MSSTVSHKHLNPRDCSTSLNASSPVAIISGLKSFFYQLSRRLLECESYDGDSGTMIIRKKMKKKLMDDDMNTAGDDDNDEYNDDDEEETDTEGEDDEVDQGSESEEEEDDDDMDIEGAGMRHEWEKVRGGCPTR
jgi:hypothetical protein